MMYVGEWVRMRSDKVGVKGFCYIFFFFQAEDGIRDAQESRGLGDVYKRQPPTEPTDTAGRPPFPPGDQRKRKPPQSPVSQTKERSPEPEASYLISWPHGIRDPRDNHHTRHAPSRRREDINMKMALH